LLSVGEAADFLGLAKQTLANWRSAGPPPHTPPLPFVKVGRAVKYDQADLLAFVEAARVMK
jgi:hypothetical protein